MVLGRDTSPFPTRGWQKPQHCILLDLHVHTPGPEADRSSGERLRVTEAGNLAWQVQNKMCVYIFYTHTYIN